METTNPEAVLAAQQAAEKSKTEYGNSVTVHNRWVRHSQKMSGEVFNAGGTGISASSISPGGAERATKLGMIITPAEHGMKGYISDSSRTKETLESMIEGYQRNDDKAPIRGLRVKEELVAWGSEGFNTLYNFKFATNKNRLMEERGLKPEEFSKLSPDEQEQIAETAEEPIVREWLDNPNSELAKLHPPRNAAAKFAVLFNRRHERLADKLKSDSDIDVTHVTHKTVTEPFLASGVLIRKQDGQRITKIADLGGSLQILDNWESSVHTNESGEPTITVIIRGQEYTVDSALVQELAVEGLAMLKDSGRNVQKEAQKKLKDYKES